MAIKEYTTTFQSMESCKGSLNSNYITLSRIKENNYFHFLEIVIMTCYVKWSYIALSDKSVVNPVEMLGYPVTICQ